MSKYYTLVKQLERVRMAYTILSDYKIEKGSLLQKILFQLTEELLNLSLQLDALKIEGNN